MCPPLAQWPEGDDDALIMPSLQARLQPESSVIVREQEIHSA
jgi:hypothetical protein